MPSKYKDNFILYKNCRSVYFFNKIKKTKKSVFYKVTNKVKNSYDKYVVYHKPCILKRRELTDFINYNITYSKTSLSTSSKCCY